MLGLVLRDVVLDRGLADGEEDDGDRDNHDPRHDDEEREVVHVVEA